MAKWWWFRWPCDNASGGSGYGPKKQNRGAMARFRKMAVRGDRQGG
jgi:hypothetical protein